MLKKSARLTTAAFDAAFAAGRRLHTPYFQLIYVPAASFHASAVAGKKVAKTAVGRNRLRRQMYGALYRASKQTPLPYTVILVAKPALAKLSSKAVAPAVVEVLQLLSKRG